MVSREHLQIANEVHDAVIQAIFAVGLSLDGCRLALRENPDEADALLGDAAASLNQALADIRAYILDLTQRVDDAILREAAEGPARQNGHSDSSDVPPAALSLDGSPSAARR